jgi:hypothetical protein
VNGARSLLRMTGTDLKLTRCQQARHDFIQIWDYQLAAAIVYQFWLVGAGGNGGWGRAKPIVPGGASMLALRVSTCCNVVRNAAITVITKAVAKIANTVRWVFIIDPPASTDLAVGWPRFLPREGNFFEAASSTSVALRPERISEQAVEFLFANGIALARALFDPSSI